MLGVGAPGLRHHRLAGVSRRCRGTRTVVAFVFGGRRRRRWHSRWTQPPRDHQPHLRGDRHRHLSLALHHRGVSGSILLSWPAGPQSRTSHQSAPFSCARCPSCCSPSWSSSTPTCGRWRATISRGRGLWLALLFLAGDRDRVHRLGHGGTRASDAGRGARESVDRRRRAVDRHAVREDARSGPPAIRCHGLSRATWCSYSPRRRCFRSGWWRWLPGLIFLVLGLILLSPELLSSGHETVPAMARSWG